MFYLNTDFFLGQLWTLKKNIPVAKRNTKENSDKK